MTYLNLPASAPKVTKALESISEDIHCPRASSLILELDESEDQTNTTSSTTKADAKFIPTELEDEEQADDINIISTEPEDKANTDSSTPEVDNNIISTKLEDEEQANTSPYNPKTDNNAVILTKLKDRGRLDTSPVLRKVGLVSKETEGASLKREIVLSYFEPTR